MSAQELVGLLLDYCRDARVELAAYGPVEPDAPTPSYVVVARTRGGAFNTAVAHPDYVPGLHAFELVTTIGDERPGETDLEVALEYRIADELERLRSERRRAAARPCPTHPGFRADGCGPCEATIEREGRDR